MARNLLVVEVPLRGGHRGVAERPQIRGLEGRPTFVVRGPADGLSSQVIQEAVGWPLFDVVTQTRRAGIHSAGGLPRRRQYVRSVRGLTE